MLVGIYIAIAIVGNNTRVPHKNLKQSQDKVQQSTSGHASRGHDSRVTDTSALLGSLRHFLQLLRYVNNLMSVS